MATTVFRVEKIKSFSKLSECDNHNLRLTNVSNANKDLQHLNMSLMKEKCSLSAVRNMIERYEIKPRKNAVIAYDGILSLSNDAFKNESDVKKFTTSAIEFLKHEFGGRVRVAELHRDEETAHIHFTLVPIVKCDKKGYKLDARSYMSRAKLKGMQKRYYQHMKIAGFDIKPPNFGGKAKHTKVKKFYQEINENADEIINEVAELLKEKIEERSDYILDAVVSKFSEIIEASFPDQASELIEHNKSLMIEKKTSYISESDAIIRSQLCEDLKPQVTETINTVIKKRLSSCAESKQKPRF